MSKTTNTNHGELKRIPLGDIVPSRTNPRKTFKTPDWPDFVDNIRTHGVIQPGLARVHPKDCDKYELVAGERRYRASLEGKLPDMPLVIRDLTDAEVITLQQIENLQREDLSPLEEAQGYADWRDSLIKNKEVKTVDEAVAFICEKIKRKRSSVYARLALLKTSPTVQEALKSGRLDASKAGLVATIPDTKVQDQFLKSIENPRYGDGPLSYRQAEELLKRDYQVSLADPPFATTESYELKGGGHNGPCLVCPMRMNKKCLNVACFIAKKTVHAELAMAKARAEKKLVVDPKYYNGRSHDYYDTDCECYQDSKNRTYGELAKKAGIEPAVTFDERKGLVKVFTEQQISAIKSENGIKEYSGGRSSRDVAAERRKQAKRKAMTEVFGAAIPKILEKLVPKGKIDPQLLPLLAKEVYHRSAIDRHDFMAKRLGISKKISESRQNLDKHFEQHASPAESAALLVEITLLADTGYSSWGKVEWDEYALAAAKLAGIDLNKELGKYEKAKTIKPKPAKKK